MAGIRFPIGSPHPQAGAIASPGLRLVAGSQGLPGEAKGDTLQVGIEGIDFPHETLGGNLQSPA